MFVDGGVGEGVDEVCSFGIEDSRSKGEIGRVGIRIGVGVGVVEGFGGYFLVILVVAIGLIDVVARQLVDCWFLLGEKTVGV